MERLADSLMLAPAIPAPLDLTLSRASQAPLPPHSWASHVLPLRQLAVQLASLASLEDVVTHSIRSILASPSELVAPIVADDRALPASLSRARSRSRRGSILLSERGSPTGLAVKNCPPAPPEPSCYSHHPSDSPAPAPGPQEPASATRSARASLPMPRGASAGPQAPAAQLARRSSGAAEAGRRSRDKRRWRTRKQAKRSMWREIQL